MKLSLKFLLILALGIFLVGSVSALTADIAYVLKNPSSPNQKIIGAIQDLGYSYELIDDSKVSTTNFANYGLILLGNEGINGVPTNDHKSLVMDFNYYSGWASRKAQTTSNKAYNIAGQITEGVQGTFTPYTQSGRTLYYLSYQKTSKAITTRGTTNSEMGNFVVSQKDNPRRILFGISDTAYWTTTSEQLFKGSLIWVLKGGDSDSDGYLKEDDCNDSDASVNPGSTNLSKNCRNDSPTLSSIGTISVNRGDTVSLTLNAVDPEGDTLTYSIDDSRFVKVTDNGFQWDTTGYGIGNYSFVASVSDGSFNYLRSFTVKILNRVPTCTNIPTVVWGEDSNYTLDLNDYCSDLDNDDALIFGVENTSEDQNILLSSLISGIAKFSPGEDWYGTDWIKFFVKDIYSGKVLTNEVILEVLPINDPLEFDGPIEVIVMNEDTSKTINLSNYFSDIDSQLTYVVTGNSKISVSIAGNIATLTPDSDWFGVETSVFYAFDEESNIGSNNVSVVVNNVNDAPEFDSIICDTNLLEDFGYNCLINASDKEGNSLTYSVVFENNLDCSFNGADLTYQSFTDYFGPASCQIRVSDGASSTLFDFNVEVENVNDGPFIQSYSPVNDVRIILGKTKQFSVVVRDIDSSNLEFSWLVNDVVVGNSQTYTYEGNVEGNFNLKVVLSDGVLTDSHEWNVFVGNIGEFTCLEASGFEYAENQVCPGETLAVKDTPRCCTVKGIYGFSDIDSDDRCGLSSSNLDLKIDDPNDGDNFGIDEDLNVLTISKHNFNDTHRFEIKTYFYDLGEDKVIEDKNERKSIDEEDEEEIEFDFGVFDSYDIDFDSSLAVFSILRDRGTNECVEKYIEIGLQREEHDVVISEFEIYDGITCGSEIEFTGEIKNIGETDENVDVTVEIPKMKIKKTLDEFVIKSDDNEKVQYFEFNGLYVPIDAPSGEYDLTFTVHFDDGRLSESEKYKFNVSGCADGSNNVISGSDVQPLALNSVATQDDDTNDNSVSLNGAVLNAPAEEPDLDKQIPVLTAVVIFLLFGIVVLKYVSISRI